MNGTEKQNETSMEMPAEDSRVTMGNQTEKKHRFHLKMPQKGRKHSVKKRIAYTFIATMAATLLIIGLINYFFLGSFYIRDKENILAESFQKLNATGGDSDDIPDTFEQFCVTNNLKVIITGPELSSFVYSNATDRQSLQTLIFGQISGNEQANTKVVDSKDNYQIQKFYDSHADAEYLQIIGWFDNGNRLLKLFGHDIEVVSKLADLVFSAAHVAGIEVKGCHFFRNFGQLLHRTDDLAGDDPDHNCTDDEMRREFLSNVTHELKTPIALIQGYAEGLKDNINDDEESREFYCVFLSISFCSSTFALFSSEIACSSCSI